MPPHNISTLILSNRAGIQHYSYRRTEALGREIVPKLCSNNAAVSVGPCDFSPYHSDFAALSLLWCAIDESYLLAEVEALLFLLISQYSIITPDLFDYREHETWGCILCCLWIIHAFNFDKRCIWVCVSFATLIREVTTPKRIS